MATGRTVNKFARCYVGGYDLSGYVRQLGDMLTEFDAEPQAALSDGVKNVLIGQANFKIGDYNAFLDNTATSGLHVLHSAPGAKRAVMMPIGIRAVPAAGDPCFLGEFDQLSYHAQGEGGFTAASLKFGPMDATAAALAYSKAWGNLLHAYGAETGTNSGTGIDDNGASSALGGYLMYQIFAVAGTGNVTIKVQDASTNSDGSFADLTGATSGAIAHTAVPTAGVVAIGRSATVKRYLRWQIALSGITSVTFALAFVRANF